MRAGVRVHEKRNDEGTAARARSKSRSTRFESVVSAQAWKGGPDDGNGFRKRTFVQPRAGPIPPLEPDDRLSRAEFERRYHAMPNLKKAELIEGVVYIPSPVRVRRHGGPHFDLITWLGTYKALTPGITGADNASVRLDLDNEPQPDVVLFIDPANGGQARITDEDYLDSAPELVAEIAASRPATT